MTERYRHALSFAAEAHGGQVRKGTAIPYVTHPASVSALVAQYGGDEDQVIAALLHDVIEDCPGYDRHAIAAKFGERVARIVEGCTDGEPGQERSSSTWRERKEAYLHHLQHADPEVLLVSACDKLHNAEAIVADLRDELPVFDRFNQGPAQVAWYYRGLSDAFTDRVPRALGQRLASAVREIEAAAARLREAAAANGGT